STFLHPADHPFHYPELSPPDPPRTAIYALSLHDALPIFGAGIRGPSTRSSAGSSARGRSVSSAMAGATSTRPSGRASSASARRRSEEHTSELQSRENLVCRLLLEKKNKATQTPNLPHELA